MRRLRQTGRRQVVELGAEWPGELAAQQHGEVEAVEVGAAGGPDEVRRQPLVEVGEQRTVGEVRPRLAERVVEEADPCPQLLGRGRPRERAELGGADPLDERRRRLVTRLRSPPLLTQPQRVEPSLDPLDELVALPHQPAILDDAFEHGGDVGRIDRCAEADARAGALAVEVGGDEERHGRQRVVVGDPCAGAGAQLELAGPAAAGETVGESGEQCGARVVGVDGVEVEGDAGTPGDVRGTLAHSGGRPIAAAHEIDAHRQVGRRVTVADDVALVDEGGDDARQRVRSPDDHPRQPRVDGQPEHAPAERRDGAVTVERAELGQQLARLAPRLGRRAVEEGQLVRWRAPAGQLEHQPGEVDLGDLGGAVGRPGAVLHPAPQAVGNARSEAAGPAGALVRRVAADRHRGEAGHAGADVEARRSGQPAVDDDADTLDRQRRLGDVGRQHDAAPAGWRRGERAVLLVGAEGAGEAVDVDVGGGQTLGGPRDLGDAGEEGEYVSVVVAQCRQHSGGDGRFEALVPGAWSPADVDGVRSTRALDDRRGAEQPGEAGGVGGGRHGDDAQVGPQGGRCVERESEAEVGRQVALVDLVEHDQADAGELGVLLQAAGEDAFGHHLDAGRRSDAALVACLVADESADLGRREVGHAPGGSAGGQPARFQHDDAPPGEPRLVEQGERDDRRLAGAGRGGDDRPCPAGAQRGAQVVEHLDDGEVGESQRQASGGRPAERAGIADDRDVGGPPRRRIGHGVGDRTPRRRTPPFGGRRDGAVDADEDERRELGQAECLDGGAVGIGEDEELRGERAEEGATVGVVGGDEEVDPGV